jgi:hypothetical protein
MNATDTTIIAEVAAEFGRASQRFTAAKADFIKTAELSPAAAVGWARTVATEEAEYVEWMRLHERLAKVGEDEEGKPAVILKEFVEDLLDTILCNVGGGQSTCPFTRAKFAAEQDGTKSALKAMRRLARKRCL